MIIPIGTDAPLYHWPWMTLVLVGLNVVSFLATGFGRDYDGWMLSYGNGIHPIEWLAYSFFHVNGMHLLTNMFFLWGFGIVVEGKLGWWKFLTLYLGIAVLGGALIQGAMLKHKPREMPRLQIANPAAQQQLPNQAATPPADATQLPQGASPTNSFPQNSSPPVQPQPQFVPNQPVVPSRPEFPPQQFGQLEMNDDDPGDEEIEEDRWEIDPQTGQRKRRSASNEVSTRDIAGILWGNASVFRKPGLKGASIMVYALLAITLVWAPKNEITCFVLRVPPGTFEVEYFYFCGFRVLMQLLYAWLTSFQVTEEFGHFYGVVTGFGIGTLLLKRGWVDCENWDLFAVLRGTHGNSYRVSDWKEKEFSTIATPLDGTKEKKPAKKAKAFRASIYADDSPRKKKSESKSDRSVAEPTDGEEFDVDDWQGFGDDTDLNQDLVLNEIETDQSPPTARGKNKKPSPKPAGAAPQKRSKPKSLEPAEQAVDDIRRALQSSKPESALQTYRDYKAKVASWDLGESDFIALGEGLHKAQLWDLAAPTMERCLERFPRASVRIRVKLAGIYVEVQRRPRAALQLLQDVTREEIPEKLLAHYDTIRTLSKQLIDMSIEDRDPPPSGEHC